MYLKGLYHKHLRTWRVTFPSLVVTWFAYLEAVKLIDAAFNKFSEYSSAKLLKILRAARNCTDENNLYKKPLKITSLVSQITTLLPFLQMM